MCGRSVDMTLSACVPCRCAFWALRARAQSLQVHRKVCMQSLLGRLHYPRGFNRNYRDVITHIDGYTMEEYANLIWIGDIIASKGPVGFQQLWAPLRAASQHYIYGTDDSDAAKARGAANMRQFAEELERLVIKKKVCALHCAMFSAQRAHRMQHASADSRLPYIPQAVCCCACDAEKTLLQCCCNINAP